MFSGADAKVIENLAIRSPAEQAKTDPERPKPSGVVSKLTIFKSTCFTSNIVYPKVSSLELNTDSLYKIGSI